MPGDSWEARQGSRVALEKEIHQHSQAIINLKRQLNLLTSLFTLPTEIIREIIHLHTTRSHTGFSYQANKKITYRWAQITHVCHHIREIAISMPMLWKDIILPCRVKWADEMIQRSVGLPLNVVYNTMASLPHKAEQEAIPSLQLVMAEMKRIEGLELHLSRSTYQKIMDRLHDNGPQLRRLVIINPYSMQSLGREPPILALTDQLFPRLENLELKGFAVDWNILQSCTHLLSLEIEYYSISRPHPVSIHDVLSTLSCLPFLKNLKLANVIPRRSGSRGIQRGKPITLANLERFSLSGDGAPCAQLLQLLVFPATAQLELSYSFLDETDLPFLMPPIISKLSGESVIGQSQSIRSLAFGFGFNHAFMLILRAWASVIPLSRPTVELTNISPTFHLGLPNWAMEMDGVVSQFDLSHIETLWIVASVTERLNPTFLLRILNLIPQIKTVRFTEWRGRELLDLLCQSNDDQRVLPCMEELVLDSLQLECCKAHTGGTNQHEGCATALRRILVSRLPNGFKLRRLVLENCTNIDKQLVWSFGTIAQEVQWDEYEVITNEFFNLPYTRAIATDEAVED